MKLYVNEKLLSIHRKFHIKDETGTDVYEISSKIISFRDKTTISDMNGIKVAYIEQEIFHIAPHYNVYINDNFAFKIIRKIKLFKCEYSLSNGYRVEGNPMMLDFKIYDDDNNQIGSITRKLVSIGDKYEIDIYNTTKNDIVLAIIVAIVNDINRMQNSSD